MSWFIMADLSDAPEHCGAPPRLKLSLRGGAATEAIPAHDTGDCFASLAVT